MELEKEALKQFGHRIKWARKHKEMSCKDLAEAIGDTAERTVMNWETGKPPAIEKLIKMIAILEINPSYLLEPFLKKEDEYLSEIVERIHRIWKLEANRKLLDDFLEGVLEKRLKEEQDRKEQGEGGGEMEG